MDQLRKEMIHHDRKVIRRKKKDLKVHRKQIRKDHSDFMKDIRYV